MLFCEGRVQAKRSCAKRAKLKSEVLDKLEASAPPFLLSLFLLSNACAFIYLLLAVWLSMHACASRASTLKSCEPPPAARTK